ncbi:alpha/beta hydrolase [Leptospira gomenensis]|uniref:Alpha/beta hydrolase n=1 Tax=Leptospira gomenensis TaxID=2484974 RepID=A0A5F1YYU5_9LEPT|nr:alpha/beta hydrolase [Leptospira gomenensis]TGK32641.1 alpha/beta hydrolase [Leptospira gomenensis]TGK36789.1 alpha/beta hydrolase [Leptospira gomenensis]TGK48805.1 alpha/beta hydrolase [Leptospira gomenensis]TGK64571.1 alpha/beta hydrolase [Leptospira gomenensis]
MKHFFSAIRFALNTRSNSSKGIQEEDFTVSLSGESVGVLKFFPANRTSFQGTILAINGMAYLGNKDPRFQAVCRGLASCGFLVFCPQMQEISEFKIRLESIEKIKQLILKFSSDANVCPDGTISLLAPSFSASMGLIAAAAPQLEGKVKSILTIGAYGNVQTTLDYLMSAEGSDEYGRMILLWNFVHFGIGENEEIRKALHASILDGSFLRETPELPKVLDSIRPDNRELFLKLKEDREFRAEIWNKIVRNAGPFRSFLQDLQVDNKLEDLRAHVALIHGVSDNVVPASESGLILERLRERDVPKDRSKLVLTPLISHGDIGITLRTLPAIFKLLSGFAFFFKHASRS